LGYRFDEKPGRDNVESRILVGYTVMVIEDPAEVYRFVQDLATSNTLVVRIRSLNAGRTIADYKLDGVQQAIEAGFAGCLSSNRRPRLRLWKSGAGAPTPDISRSRVWTRSRVAP
jgi:hypothetical protein